jgi:hypothetical protein
MIRGRIQAGRRQVGGRSEEGRRKVGDKTEKFHLNGHPNGMQNPEFKPLLSEKIIRCALKLLSKLYGAKV